MKKNRKGFTLAELLVVVAVIAVLVAVAIPTFSSQLEKSRQGVDIANLRGAYAVARIAEMDQGIEGEAFRSDADNATHFNVTTATGSPAAKRGVITCYYNPDTGGLVKTAPSGYLKAKGTLVGDISNLPGGGDNANSAIIVYEGIKQVKKSDTSPNFSAGSGDLAVSSCIEVQYTETSAGSGVYKLEAGAIHFGTLATSTGGGTGGTGG